MTSQSSVFLYLEVDAPNFYKQNAITAWLSQDGKPSEERFGMLLDVLRVRMTERMEKY